MTINDFYYSFPEGGIIPEKKISWYAKLAEHRIVITPEYRKYLTDYFSYKKAKQFNTFDVSVLFPCMDVNGHVNGLVIRSLVRKAFYNYTEFPVMLWGLENFKGFQWGMPIVLVEGIKDAIVIRQKYPYVLAYMTSGIQQFKWAYLKKLTDKFLVIPDNDDAGKAFAKKLVKEHPGVDILFPIHKDAGQYVEKGDKAGLKQFLDLVKMKTHFMDDIPF